MNIKRRLVPVLFSAGLLGSLAHAESVAPPDPVTASFQRLLGHQPTRTAPAVPPGFAADPLRSSLSAVLWEKPGPSFHVLANSTPVSPPTRPKD